MKRIIIFTGKGGVGKTSVTAAHARKASMEGLKTLLVSTDMAHNLSDLLECSIGREVTKAADHLYALEVDPTYEMTHDFSAMMQAFEKLMSFQREDGSDSLELLEMFPGIEELFSLLKIQLLFEKGDYDLIVVDCAPTGETLSLLKFPELLSWYMEKLFPIGKVAMKVARPISKTVLNLELPDGKAMNDIERFYCKLGQLQALMKNPEICSVRLVTVPEKMVVEETKRNYMYMNLYGFHVDGVYINRILPENVDNSFFSEWLKIQAHYIEELEGLFGEIPIHRIPWFDIDLNGMESLDRVIESALKEQNLFEIREIRSGEVYEKTAEGYLMSIYLPGIEKTDLVMHQAGNDLILKIGNVKRNIRKPDVLRDFSVGSAKFQDNLLKVSFVKEDADE